MLHCETNGSTAHTLHSFSMALVASQYQCPDRCTASSVYAPSAESSDRQLGFYEWQPRHAPVLAPAGALFNSALTICNETTSRYLRHDSLERFKPST